MQIPRFKPLPELCRIIGCALVALMAAHAALALQPAAEVERLRGELEVLRLRYTDKHPDVVRILGEIERLEAERSATAQEPDATAANPAPATYFKFQKTGTLVKRPEGMPKPGPYWPTLVSMEAVKDFPFDYALYFSTDHHRGKGGIWLYICSGIPSDPGCWSSYDDAVAAGAFDHIEQKPRKNPIYIDTVQGNQTETPHANVIDGIVYMTYHNKGAGHHQSTLLATSPDGVNFTRINGDADSVILDYAPKTAPGNGHTGYFRWGPNPFSVLQYEYVGYSLHGGGRRPNFASWVSHDAIHWHKLRILPKSFSAVSEPDRWISWIVDLNSVKALDSNDYLAISAGGIPRWGLHKAVAEIYEVRLSNQGDRFKSAAKILITTGPVGSADHFLASQPTTVFVGNQWHLLYIGLTNEGGESAILGAVGVLTVDVD